MVLAVVQAGLALTWVIYVIYLPALAVQAGLPKSAVPWILMMDQLIFIACDWAAGVLADRTAKAVGRIGSRIAMATLASAIAFLALPFVAPAASPAVFIALTIVWSATSSALRAPPLTLIGRHAATPSHPWLAGLYLLGLGLAGAAAPYLGAHLRNVDPRIPFAIATTIVVVATFALAAAERRLPSPPPAQPGTQEPPRLGTIALFAAAIALFASGFQLHFSVASAPSYLRFATPADLERLMPVFWIGFNLVVLPATLLTKRYGGIAMMAVGGTLATLLALAAPRAPTLDVLVALHFAIGAAWSVVLTSAFTAALEAGRPGREGSVTGLLFSMLALAALARISFVTLELPKLPAIAPMLPTLPAVIWSAASLAIVVLLVRSSPRPAAGSAR